MKKINTKIASALLAAGVTLSVESAASLPRDSLLETIDYKVPSHFIKNLEPISEETEFMYDGNSSCSNGVCW